MSGPVSTKAAGDKSGSHARKGLQAHDQSTQDHSLISDMVAVQRSVGNRTVADLISAQPNTNLRNIHIHTGPAADSRADAQGAVAYASGRDVYLGSAVDLETDLGRRVLAHELTHIVQQERGRAGIPHSSQSSLEYEAHASSRDGTLSTGAAIPGSVQRITKDDLRIMQAEDLSYEEEEISREQQPRRQSAAPSARSPRSSSSARGTGELMPAIEAKNQLLQMLKEAQDGKFSSLSQKNKLRKLKQFKTVLRLADPTDLPKTQNKLQGDFDEALRTPRSGLTGKPQQKFVAGSPQMPAHDLPTGRSGYAQPDYSVQIVTDSGGRVRGHVNLKSHDLEQVSVAEGRAIAKKVVQQAARNVFGNAARRGSLGHLPEREPIIISFAETPNQEVQNSMVSELFGPGSPISEVRFGPTTYKRASYTSVGAVSTPVTPAKTPPMTAALAPKSQGVADESEQISQPTLSSTQRLVPVLTPELGYKPPVPAPEEAQVPESKPSEKVQKPILSAPATGAANASEQQAGLPTLAIPPRVVTAQKATIEPFSQTREEVATREPAAGAGAAAGAAEILVQLEQQAEINQQYKEAMRDSAIRTLQWWAQKGVYPKARAVVDHWFDEDQYTPVLANTLSSVGPFDGLVVDKLTEPIHYHSFEEWAQRHVRNYDDFVRFFLQVPDPGVRRRDDGVWEVLAWRWGDYFPASDYREWEEDAQIASFMEPIYQRLIKQTAAEFAEVGQHRRELSQGRVIGVRHLRHESGVVKAIYSPTQPTVPLFDNALWQFSFEPVFFELESKNVNVPPGFSLVTGADVNTYAALRETRVWFEETQPQLTSADSPPPQMSGFRPNVDAIGLVETRSLTNVRPAEAK